ncbi:hypothetical protein OS125_11445 [Corynebacterium sp. P7003]|uniref:Uncharacterized protein n=1 Tax=Corynebacterium pygosceleis TaxID=2800406 RepID=A0ABT3WUE0_9CORY|nr:hypothetical protein [Corynebacterium pygosceleis]MCX7445845.1 hypothetical protein [Corynebacterium pygosceleis]
MSSEKRRPLVDKAYDVVVEQVRAKTGGRALAQAFATVAYGHFARRDIFSSCYWTGPKMAAILQTAAGTPPRIRKDTRDVLTDDGLLDQDGDLTPKGWAAAEYLRRTQR